MPKNQSKDLLSRVADLGEEALHRLPHFPGSDRMVEMMNQSKTRLDEMQKRLRGLDVLESRVDALEQRVAQLEKPKPAVAKPVRKETTSSAERTLSDKPPA